MIIWIAPVLGFLRSALPYALLFLRSIPDLLAPKPTPVSAPFTPPFMGGQCVGIVYRWRITMALNGDYGSPYRFEGERYGAVTMPYAKLSAGALGAEGYFSINWSDTERVTQENFTPARSVWTFQILGRSDGQSDTCGNTPNPIPSPAIPDDGLFNPSNPRIADDNGTLNPAAIVLAPAAPLVLINGLGTAIGAALAAARAAASALDAIQKVAEALEGLGKLWDKLQEFLDEWEKNRPKKRDIVRQTYGRILGDGALDFFPNNNTKFQAIQLDVVITNIPIGFGRYFGNLSPSRYRFRELGYIAFYSVNQGILEVHSIQFKRTSYQIPELAVGFIYHLGLDEQIKGYAFGTFSVEKT